MACVCTQFLPIRPQLGYKYIPICWFICNVWCLSLQPMPIVSSSRYLVKRGRVTELKLQDRLFGRTSIMRRPIQLFSFSDFIIVGKKKKAYSLVHSHAHELRTYVSIVILCSSPSFGGCGHAFYLTGIPPSGLVNLFQKLIKCVEQQPIQLDCAVACTYFRILIPLQSHRVIVFCNESILSTSFVLG